MEFALLNEWFIPLTARLELAGKVRDVLEENPIDTREDIVVAFQKALPELRSAKRLTWMRNAIETIIKELTVENDKLVKVLDEDPEWVSVDRKEYSDPFKTDLYFNDDDYRMYELTKSVNKFRALNRKPDNHNEYRRVFDKVYDLMDTLNDQKKDSGNTDFRTKREFRARMRTMLGI